MIKLLHLPPDSLWYNRSFLLFWGGRSISVFGSIISNVILPILVYRLTNSALHTSLVAVVEALPYFFFGLFAGALADRIDRKRLMIVCDVINTILLSSIPLAAALNILSVPHIYIVGFLSAMAYVWFDAANFGALPALVGRERVVAANSHLWSTATILEITGPSLAGALAATLNPAFVIGLDALSFALSALSLALITRAFSTVRNVETLQGVVLRRTLSDIGDGLHFLIRQPLVRTMTLLGFGNSLTGGAVMSLLIVYGVRALGLTENDARIGLLFTAGSIGSLLVSLLLPYLVKRLPVGRITLIGLSLTPLFLLCLALTSHLFVALLCYGLWSASYSLTIMNGISLRQMVTPDHLLSRVNTTARMIAWGGTPFGAAIGGLLAENTPISTTYLIMATGVGISALLSWFSPLRVAHNPQSVSLEEG